MMPPPVTSARKDRHTPMKGVRTRSGTSKARNNGLDPTGCAASLTGRPAASSSSCDAGHSSLHDDVQDYPALEATMAYDVIIVGARCAGASTAMLLARSGYRVVLIDRAKFPSEISQVISS